MLFSAGRREEEAIPKDTKLLPSGMLGGQTVRWNDKKFDDQWDAEKLDRLSTTNN